MMCGLLAGATSRDIPHTLHFGLALLLILTSLVQLKGNLPTSVVTIQWLNNDSLAC